ncbi:MAG: YgaP-like transmembrane domain [Chloroflexota bacterium]
MNGLINIMQGTAGRILRVVLGLALIYVGLALVGGTAGIVVAVIGLLPIAMGVWGPCLLSFVCKPA